MFGQSAVAAPGRRHQGHKLRLRRDASQAIIERRDAGSAAGQAVSGLSTPASGGESNVAAQSASTPSVPAPSQPTNDSNATAPSPTYIPPTPAASPSSPQPISSPSSEPAVSTPQAAAPVPTQSTQEQQPSQAQAPAPSQSQSYQQPASSSNNQVVEQPSSQQYEAPSSSSQPSQSQYSQSASSSSPAFQASASQSPPIDASSQFTQTTTAATSTSTFIDFVYASSQPTLSSQIFVGPSGASSSFGDTKAVSSPSTRAILANANGGAAITSTLVSSAAPPPPVLADNTDSDQKSAIGAGGIAGIVVALLVIGVCIVGIIMRRRTNRRSSREMSTYYNGVPSLILPQQGGTSAFTSFRDNASTRTSTIATPVQSNLSLYPGPAPTPTSAAHDDDNDSSHYGDDSHEEHNSYSSTGTPRNQSYYTAHPAPYSSRSLRMPEYNLPSPPIPALDREETLYSNQSFLHTTADIERSRSQRSIGSTRSYVDDQLKELYVGQY